MYSHNRSYIWFLWGVLNKNCSQCIIWNKGNVGCIILFTFMFCSAFTKNIFLHDLHLIRRLGINFSTKHSTFQLVANKNYVKWFENINGPFHKRVLIENFSKRLSNFAKEERHKKIFRQPLFIILPHIAKRKCIYKKLCLN